MGKLVSFDRASFNFDQSLVNNPNSVKYLQAMLRSLPLTIQIKHMDIHLTHNALNESKSLDILPGADICNMLKSFVHLESLDLELGHNLIGDTAVQKLVLSLRYLKDLRKLTLNLKQYGSLLTKQQVN